MNQLASALVVLAVTSIAVAGGPPVVSDLIINEVSFAPPPGGEKYIEFYNRGAGVIDTTNWYWCDQPASQYPRLLEVPIHGTGPPASPGIIMQPGDFLVVRAHPVDPPLPMNDYATRLNGSGTTTHMVNWYVHPGFLPFVMKSVSSNSSLWDFSNGDPNNPEFTTTGAMRDIVAWGTGGIAAGERRTCIASSQLVLLWPPVVFGQCGIPDPIPQFVGVNSDLMPPESNLSINYNGGSANDPSDYFIAPSTEGERNVMPGDIDDDFDMDGDDVTAYMGCFEQAPMSETCMRADLDGSDFVDCADWTMFLANWAMYSQLPPPEFVPCDGCAMPGDFNGDMAINGLDIQGYLNVMIGNDVSPSGMCLADMNVDGEADCFDLPIFVLSATGAIDTCLHGDANGDGVLDGRDIPRFIDALLNPSCIFGESAVFCGLDANEDLFVTIDDVEPFVLQVLGAP